MPGRSRRAGGAHRGERSTRQVAWIRRQFVNTVVTNTVIAEDFVAPSDWKRGTLNESSTVTRIRGQIHVVPAIAADTRQVLFAAMYRTDIDTAAIDPDASGILQEDLVWMDALSWGDKDATSLERGIELMWDINVRAMRKLHTDQVMRFVLKTTGGGTLTFAGFLSTLLKYG